jgi:hypothetical protein
MFRQATDPQTPEKAAGGGSFSEAVARISV